MSTQQVAGAFYGDAGVFLILFIFTISLCPFQIQIKWKKQEKKNINSL